MQTPPDLIVHRGWLNLKIRSMVNVRPRHMRYCILTRNNQMLSTYKFQLSTNDLQARDKKPLKTYKIIDVTMWKGRKNGFLLNVKDPAERVLEVDAALESIAHEWIQHLRTMIEHPIAPVSSQPLVIDDMDIVPNLPERSQSDGSLPNRKESDLWVKGASVHRGLLNASGENNCFLNVIIQSFWHLTSMRHFLLHVAIKDESKTVEANVLRALKSIMMEYDDTSSGRIHSRGLREGLSVLYAADKNFQVGAMYDAEETLLALLNFMHQQSDVTEKGTAIVKRLVRSMTDEDFEETPEAVFDKNSIPHLVFGHQIYDRYVCDTCHHTSSWDLYSNLVHTLYAVDIYSHKYDSLEHLLRTMASNGHDIVPTCDQPKCQGKNRKERVIRRFPMVFAISVLWATSAATTEQVQGLMDNIHDRVDLAKCFEAAGQVARLRNGGLRTTYLLRGFVCYYGRHYVAMFYSTAHKAWLMFDDSRVLEVGSWENVVNQCLKCRFQIVLLFYELPDKRKDSSVSLLSLAGSSESLETLGSTPTVQPRRRESTITFQESIEEDDDELLLSPPPKHGPTTSILSTVSEHDSSSSATPPKSVENGQTGATEGWKSLFSGSPPSVSQAPPAPIEPTTVYDVPTNREFELSELQHFSKTIQQDIVPVSSSIAMYPRTITMNASPASDEYDVRFSHESVVLGMYLEKIGDELCVTDFPRGVNGDMFGAEKSGIICRFDLVLLANGHPLQHYPVDRALKMIKGQMRPLVIRFKKSPRVRQLMDMGFPQDKVVEALLKCRGDVNAATIQLLSL